MPELIPTGGLTYCTVEVGSFSHTYDDSVSTKACFKMNQSCLSEWYWNNPVNVTKFRILSQFYYPYSRINKIWGRVGGSWVEVWSGTWKPSVGVVSSKTISCNNCTGIRISQTHVTQPLRTCIIDVRVEYEEVVAEGKAVITSIEAPSEFTLGVGFNINVTIRNDGGDDDFFDTITNKDTGAVISRGSTHIISGTSSTLRHINIVLTQTTTFHGRVEAGHIE